MAWLVGVFGVLVIVVVLRDILHTIFHPSGHGSLSWAAMWAVWRLARRLGKARLTMLAGPVAVLTAIVAWTALLVLGWALIYWPNLPEGFAFGSSLQPGLRSDVLDALYVSLVTGATLGYGDVIPTTAWLRVAAPLEALMGFGLLTAAVTWVLQIYPALARRRSLALRLATLLRSSPAEVVAGLDSSLSAELLTGLTAELVAVRVDLTQNSETYFFRDSDPDLALPVALTEVRDLCRRGHGSPRADTRVAAAQLQCALDDLARFLDHQFLHSGGGVEEVLAAYAADHGHELRQ